MAEKLSIEKESLFIQIESLKKEQATKQEENRLAITKAANIAKEEASSESKNEVTKMQLQLKMAQDNVNQQQNNFNEMIKQQTEQFDEQKKQQKEFFDKQLTSQKENLERDVAIRERDLVSKTKLESDLKLKEQQEMISTLTSQISNMKETAEKKSQQLQGEALEVLIEEKLMLDPTFRLDSFSEVKKGVNGVDVNMTIKNKLDEDCGLVMIEAKRAAS